MCDKTITKNNSLIIKGIASILMLIHHLYTFPNRIKAVEYISLFTILGIPIEQYIGEISKICVSIFLFISGYGMFIIYNKNNNFKFIKKRIFKLYKNYWVTFIIFIPVGILISKVDTNLKEIITNFIGVNNSLNLEWWFFSIYIVLILTYPISYKFIINLNLSYTIGLSFFIYCFGIILNIITYRNGILTYEFIFNIMSCQFPFLLGSIVANKKIFDSISKIINNKYNIILILILSIIILIVFPIKTLAYNILTPILVFCIAKLIGNCIILRYLGKHSNNIWLVHSFFCYYYFQQIIFLPRYSMLILIWLFILSLCSSYIINYISNNIDIQFNRLSIFNKEKLIN